MQDSVVILSIARTPVGNFLGALKDLSAPALGAAAIKAAVERSTLPTEAIQEVIMGCVLSAGLGQAPARQAALGAHLSQSVPCTTVNKMCGSGMKAILFAHDGIMAKSNSIYVAGGMESMSNAPYLLPKARQGHRLGHTEVLDHMMLDGLEDAYDKGRPMGYFAEQCAKEYHFDRKQQDDYAIVSLERAQQAIRDKSFEEEICPILIKARDADITISADERPLSVKIEKIPQLKPVFLKEGTVTAANSSSISDGAAAIVLTDAQTARQYGIKPLAQLVGHATFAKAPSQFATAPIQAIEKLLKKINWTVDEVDLFEINEAFAVVTLAAMKELKIPHTKLNVHGSGCALGHPIGATGARIVVTLISALKKYGLKKGVAALCIGGGEATALAVQML